MNEEQSNYKVTDRRLFNADGTPREVPVEERPVVKPEPEAAAPTPAPSAVTDQPTEAPASEAEPSVEAAAPPAAADEADLAELDDPAGFANFLMSIASNAASSLGMMEHPVTHQREVDLELGKHWIDVLGMLQKKTAGNLSAMEAKILEGWLADLRMQFVSLSSSAAAKKPAAFTGRDIIGGK